MWVKNKIGYSTITGRKKEWGGGNRWYNDTVRKQRTLAVVKIKKWFRNLMVEKKKINQESMWKASPSVHTTQMVHCVVLAREDLSLKGISSSFMDKYGITDREISFERNDLWKTKGNTSALVQKWSHPL